jgi:hypothetical protein
MLPKSGLKNPLVVSQSHLYTHAEPLSTRLCILQIAKTTQRRNLWRQWYKVRGRKKTLLSREPQDCGRHCLSYS